MGDASNSYEADLEFLARVAVKVARMEEDLGTVNAVLAEAVQKRMLGEITDYDVENAPPTKRTSNRRLAADSNVSEQVKRLRRDLDATVDELKVTPDHVKRLVDTALELDGEQSLRPCLDERQFTERLYEVPALTKTWARATEGLLESSNGTTTDRGGARSRSTRERRRAGTTSCSRTSATRSSTCRHGCCAPPCGAATPACTG